MVFSLSEDGDAIYESIQELYEDLGGITAELIIDNPKALVIENISGSEPKFNIDALRLAAHLGTELNPCNTEGLWGWLKSARICARETHEKWL
jgi:hypothetical protein